ncbi:MULTISPECIES: YceI family protein [Aequorivita]|uniref:YceI family protein n=1 Tax=Aequorivita iocasae TaxID=2803865 RepID=A0ABX7DPW3_9FLAO|nr:MULTISPECIES: YceI family protein [Aequorivita]QQX75802.1 YceI family protein [Aequorivita iocasae]UCA55262.1 YceI family protein [Aequorivita sp. F7]
MNPFILSCLVFVLSLKGWTQNDFKTKTVQILASSELFIKGDTNISEFNCNFNTLYLGEFKHVTYSKKENEIRFKDAILSLKNKGFDCGNSAINKDFHSLLKTKEYPIITLELTEITLNEHKKGKAHVKITIAGTKKEYSFPIDFFSSPTNRYVGKLKLDIRDFNLEPPKKLFGLIVIDEKIEINFDLVAEIF